MGQSFRRTLQGDSQHPRDLGVDVRAAHVVAVHGARVAAVQNKNVPKRTRGERILGSSKLWLWATAIAGTTFLGFQAFEFTSFVHEGLTIKTNLFGSSFFTLTGFHGAHVTAGVHLAAHASRNRLPSRAGPNDALNVDIAALYWHFVDVVWIAIFTLVYLIK